MRLTTDTLTRRPDPRRPRPDLQRLERAIKRLAAEKWQQRLARLKRAEQQAGREDER
jgi:hypothetical protein